MKRLRLGDLIGECMRLGIGCSSMGWYPYRNWLFEFFTTTTSGGGETPDSLVFAPPLGTTEAVTLEFGGSKAWLVKRYVQVDHPTARSYRLMAFDGKDMMVIVQALKNIAPWVLAFRGDGLHIA